MPLRDLPGLVKKSFFIKRNVSPAIIDSPYYPLRIFIEREKFPSRGTVIISDVDKTYLNTNFESIRGLMWIPFEVAIDKVTIDRMNYIYQGLRFGSGTKPSFTPLLFVTASPPLIYDALTHKMLRDGVEYDGVIMKDQPALVKKLQFQQLKTQITYKLFALFHAVKVLGNGRFSFILIGDDTESDLHIYLLFKKIIEEKPPVFKVADTLIEGGVDVDYLEGLLRIIRDINATVKVRYIFIYLSKKEIIPAGNFPPVLQYTSSSQLAIFLHRKKLINDYYLRKIVEPGSEEYELALEWLKDYGYL